jgi:hypothetical protein
MKLENRMIKALWMKLPLSIRRNFMLLPPRSLYLQSAYDAGYAAGEAGDPRPPQYGPEMRDAWDEGWGDGYRIRMAW